jgi:hypothetical protein
MGHLSAGFQSAKSYTESGGMARRWPGVLQAGRTVSGKTPAAGGGLLGRERGPNAMGAPSGTAERGVEQGRESMFGLDSRIGFHAPRPVEKLWKRHPTGPQLSKNRSTKLMT